MIEYTDPWPQWLVFYCSHLLSNEQRIELGRRIADGVPFEDLDPRNALIVFDPTPVEAVAIEPPQRKLKTPPKAQQVVIPPRVVGKVSQFAIARITKSAGSKASLDAVYIAYLQWCTEIGVTPAAGHRFIRSFVEVCDRSGIRIDDGGDQVLCIDVAIEGPALAIARSA